jgi:hypothetical protein
MKHNILKQVILEGLNNHQPAHLFWKEAVLDNLLETDDITMVQRCLTSRTWSDNQARAMHLIACRAYGNAQSQGGEQ